MSASFASSFDFNNGLGSDGTPNFYQFLGVDVNASKEEIQRLYRAKTRLFHPDKDEMMKYLNKAHDVLSDPERK